MPNNTKTMARRKLSTLPILTIFGLSMLVSNQLFAADGKAVFEKTCKMCHVPGVMGAPKIGNKSDWAPRLKQGMATLEEHAIKGFKGKKGMMPPKGGNAKLTDAEVKAAVAYMVNSSK